MRKPGWLVLTLPVAVWAAAAVTRAQAPTPAITDNPIPAPIQKSGLAVEIRDVVRLPETRGMRPADQDVTPTGWARRVDRHGALDLGPIVSRILLT